MFEKVNSMHPDKIADRIAGAIVDLGYKKEVCPKIAVEVLIGHNKCHVIIETSVNYRINEIKKIIKRIAGKVKCIIDIVRQDEHLAKNQSNTIKCGDNGIFKGVPVTIEQKELTKIAVEIFEKYPFDGKYILDNNKLTICQSNAKTEELNKVYTNSIINPLGEWTGGFNVDTGATNRKLGSDMGDGVTGGGLHGKDLSKADVSINIYAFLKAQETQKPIQLSCSIGDDYVDNRPYYEIVDIARKFINDCGGFEKFAEWGLLGINII